MSTERIDPAFEALLGTARLAELEASAHTVVGLRPDNTIGYRNGGWERFACENGAPELTNWNGTPVLDVFHPDVRSVYAALFDRVRDTSEPQDHLYQCSSPTTYREFNLRVLPLEARHLLLLHHCVVERPHHWASHDAGPLYEDADSIVTQCCHCRRTRRATDSATWDWVPDYLDRSLPNVSHGLCPSCFRHYFPKAAALRDRSRA